MQSKWIFIVNRNLNDSETKTLLEALNSGLSNWQAHNVLVGLEVNIVKNQIVLVNAVNNTSGCSIDRMKNTITGIFNSFELAAINPLQIWVQKEGYGHIYELNELLNQLESGSIGLENVICDTTVISGNTFEGLFKPIKDSWIQSRITNKVNS